MLGPRFDSTFSQHSYGFRPGRSAHGAVVQAQRYVCDGRRFVVDVDFEKFFELFNSCRRSVLRVVLTVLRAMPIARAHGSYRSTFDQNLVPNHVNLIHAQRASPRFRDAGWVNF